MKWAVEEDRTRRKGRLEWKSGKEVCLDILHSALFYFKM
jgi:hypothetical protein